MTEPASPIKPNRRFRRILGVLVMMSVVVLAVVMGYRLLIPVLPFTAQNRVLDRIPWNYKPDEPYHEMANLYTWLDNETVVYLLPDKDGKLPAVKQRIAVGKTFPPEPLSGVRTSLGIIDILASPDGTGLAITGWDANGDGQGQIFTLGEIGKLREFALYDMHLFWLADSQTLFSINTNTRQIERFSLPFGILTPFPLASGSSLPDIIDSSGTYFSNVIPVGPAKMAALESGSLFQGKHRTYALSYADDVYDVKLESVSPQGDRLLWRTSVSYIPKMAELLGKLTRNAPYPLDLQHWYTTDTQGNNPRTVYSLAPSPSPSGYGKSLYLSPKWLPDGKRLSVVHEGALYVIPVP